MVVMVIASVLLISGISYAETRPLELTVQPTCEFIKGYLVIKVPNPSEEHPDRVEKMWVTNSGQPWPANTRYNIHRKTVTVGEESRTHYWVGIQMPGAAEIPVTINMVAGAEPMNVPETNTPDGGAVRADNGRMERREPGGDWVPYYEDDSIVIYQVPHLNPKRPYKHNGKPNIVAYSYYIYNKNTGVTTVINPDLTRRWPDVFRDAAIIGGVVGGAWILYLVFFVLCA